MIESAGLRAKTYAYLMDDNSENQKSQRNKKVCNKKNTYVWKLHRLLIK